MAIKKSPVQVLYTIFCTLYDYRQKAALPREMDTVFQICIGLAREALEESRDRFDLSRRPPGLPGQAQRDDRAPTGSTS